MKPCMHQILIPEPRPLCQYLVLAHISEKFPDTKIITDFRLSHYTELNRTSGKPRFFGVVKQYLGVMIKLPYPGNTAVFSKLGTER